MRHHDTKIFFKAYKTFISGEAKLNCKTHYPQKREICGTIIILKILLRISSLDQIKKAEKEKIFFYTNRDP